MEDILKRNEEKYGLTSELICAWSQYFIDYSLLFIN
jgi:hypothetical protein